MFLTVKEVHAYLGKLMAEDPRNEEVNFTIHQGNPDFPVSEGDFVSGIGVVPNDSPLEGEATIEYVYLNVEG